MPYVNIRLAGQLSREQKQQIVQEMTATLERVANKSREYVVISFDEMAEENWGWGGVLLDEIE